MCVKFWWFEAGTAGHTTLLGFSMSCSQNLEGQRPNKAKEIDTELFVVFCYTVSHGAMVGSLH